MLYFKRDNVLADKTNQNFELHHKEILFIIFIYFND